MLRHLPQMMGLVILAITLPISAPAQERIVYTAELRAASEVPPTASPGYGHAWVLLEPQTGTLRYAVISAAFGEKATASHIHIGGAASNGRVRYPLVIDATGNGVGTLQLTAGEVADFLRTEYYVNVHTERYPSGAIRGQLKLNPEGDARYWTEMSAANENPPTTSKAKAVAFVYVDRQSDLLAYWIASEGFTGEAPLAITGSHIHSGGAKQNGGVLVGLPVDRTGNGTGLVLLTEKQKSDISRTELYVNLHTGEFPAGAIRGQLNADPGPSIQYVYNRNARSFSREFGFDRSYSVLDAKAYTSGDLVSLVSQALALGPPEVVVAPAFDPKEFPNGPLHAQVRTKSVKLAVDSEFHVDPGLIVSAQNVPGGVSAEDFHDLYFQAYGIAINDVAITELGAMPYLAGPYVVGGRQFGLPDATPSLAVTGYNITLRIGTPGEYWVVVHWRTTKTIPKANPDGSDLMAMEYTVVIPVLVEGTRDRLPLTVSEFEESSQSLATSLEQLSRAIRDAVDGSIADKAVSKIRQR